MLQREVEPRILRSGNVGLIWSMRWKWSQFKSHWKWFFTLDLLLHLDYLLRVSWSSMLKKSELKSREDEVEECKLIAVDLLLVRLSASVLSFCWCWSLISNLSESGKGRREEKEEEERMKIEKRFDHRPSFPWIPYSIEAHPLLSLWLLHAFNQKCQIHFQQIDLFIQTNIYL